MHLQNISLLNFKNYEELRLDFSPKINCLVGENGSGKTNLLDAIHYLSLSKSAFNSVDSQNIRHQQDYFVIQGDFQIEEENYHILCGVQKRQKKVLKVNKKPYDKISEHIGRFPVVLISPQDTDLIREGSEIRRKFFDSIISQLDQAYLQHLIAYNHILKQRNSLLKQFFEKNYVDRDLLNTYDQQLLPLGKKICERRSLFIHDFQPLFNNYYQYISNQKENCSIQYQSDFKDENYIVNFEKHLEKDLRWQRTNQGIHKDDYEFMIGEYPLKKYGSQGQQKSFVIALKLSHFQIIWEQKQKKAILLLDDIFDKLDDQRMDKLIQQVSQDTFGQIFVTDARPERTLKVFEPIQMDKKMIHLNQGKTVRIQ